MSLLLVSKFKIILNLLTNNRDITLIYSVTICEQIQRVVYGQGTSNINYTILVFNFDVCPLSYNQSHLLSMVWTGKFDLNTPHVDVKLSKSAKKNLRIQHIWISVDEYGQEGAHK